MIYTLTLNPALDYVISVDDFNEGEINRTNSENIFAGGKGINVSTVLNNLGKENTALGFIAGDTGNMLDDMLKKQGYNTDFVRASEGMTRINVKLSAMSFSKELGEASKEKNCVETEINGRGPVIKEENIEELYYKLCKLTKGDILIMSGSIPAGVPKDIYGKICAVLREREADYIVDAVTDILLNTLKYEPLLVKPNHHELGAIFNTKIEDYEETVYYAKELRKMGAKNVMVSMASKGAVLVDEYDNSYYAEAPSGEVVNSVGAGDTTVGMFVASYIDQMNKIDTNGFIDYSGILKNAVCAGSATAFNKGIATKLEIERLIPFCKGSKTIS